MKIVRLFLYAAMLLTICEVTGITFLARQDKAFCYVAGEFETPAEDDDEIEDTDDLFLDSHIAFSMLANAGKRYGSTAQIEFTQPLSEIIVPPPQG